MARRLVACLRCLLSVLAVVIPSSSAATAATQGHAGSLREARSLSAKQVQHVFLEHGYKLRQIKVDQIADTVFLSGASDKYIVTVEVVLNQKFFRGYWLEYSGFAYGNYPITHVGNVIIDCERHTAGRIDTNAKPLRSFPANVASAISELRSLQAAA
jgi:hypothetical protein